MRIELKTTLSIINKIEKTIYLNGLPNKDFINHQRIDLMIEVIITNLILSHGFTYYLNSLKENNDNIYINVIIARVDKGKEDFRIKLPRITTNYYTLDFLRKTYINSEDKFKYTTYYYEQIHKQIEGVLPNNILPGTNRVYVKEGFNKSEQLSIFF